MRTMNERCVWVMAVAMLLLSAVLLPAPDASARESWAILNYEMSIPTGDTSDFVDQTSFRGIGFEGRWFQAHNTSIGYSLDWNVLHEKTSDAIVANNATVSGVQDRTINVFPMLVTGHYYFGPDHLFFAGLGAGLYFMEQRLDIGIFTLDNDTWHLGVAPEIGMAFDLTYDVKAILGLRYNYGFEASGTKIDYMTVKFGIGF